QFMVQFPHKEAEINLAKDIILRMTVKEPALSEIHIHDIAETVMQQTSSSTTSDKNAAKINWKVPRGIGIATATFAVVIMLLSYIVQTHKHTTSQRTESTFTTQTNSS